MGSTSVCVVLCCVVLLWLSFFFSDFAIFFFSSSSSSPRFVHFCSPAHRKMKFRFLLQQER